MRRAALAILLCAAPPAVAAPVAAGGTPIERAALRSALRAEASAASAQVRRLPLPAATGQARLAGSFKLAELASETGPRRLLVGLRSHGDRAAVERVLERLGLQARTLPSIGVLAVRAAPAGVIAALGGNPAVSFIERDQVLRKADPGDARDPKHANLPYTWAFPFVRAGQALAAAGGGSTRLIAVIDTGLDLGHPDLAGRIAQPVDAVYGGTDVADRNGHGTFVAGLIAAVDGNGIGGKGVAGNTRVLPVRASLDGRFSVFDIVDGIDGAIRGGADILNFSLAGEGLSETQARALDLAFFNDLLPVAASGNMGDQGNPLEFPAAAVGGFRGEAGIGLSVAAVDPLGRHASFSDHNDFVSLAAPGAGMRPCTGVLSTVPRNHGTIWDDPGDPCAPQTLALGPGGRWAYGEGTSFAAPIVSGLAALVWQVEPRLASEQVADVLVRSATQTIAGGSWNEFTGGGLINGQAAAALALRYDVRAPKARGKARRKGKRRVAVRVKRSRDRTHAGRELAGHVRYSLLVSKDGGDTFDFAAGPRKRPFKKRIRLRGRKRHLLVATVCDGNGNCNSKRLGRFRKKN